MPARLARRAGAATAHERMRGLSVMYAMSCLFMTRAACHAVVEAISHGHEAEGRMGRDVPAIIVSQYDRRRYRDKVRRCLDVFARMLQDARLRVRLIWAGSGSGSFWLEGLVV